jgi:hypothetical protein
MCCPPEMAGDLWPHVRPMVGSALDRTDLGALSDLDTDVLSGRALLWIIASDGTIESAGVTRLEITQHSKVCLIVAHGGSGANRWLHLLEGIENYARAEGCDCVRWIGRRGWKRKLPEYKEIGVVMERKV